MKIIIANCNPIHQSITTNLKEKYNTVILSREEDLNLKLLKKVQPQYIFFLHWSFIIPKEVWSNYTCVVFHMTDLPFGRGGSPLQNLIVRGIRNTKITALKVDAGLDTGDVYLKKELNLNGTAEEIFLRAGSIMATMIEIIVTKNLRPSPQEGKPLVFKRRKPQDGDIKDLQTLEQLFDYIRMLDAEGYPKAFLETAHFRLEFSRASLKKDSLLADVRIIKK